MKWSDWQDRWPLAQHSQFVDARPYRWHVQQVGTGPDLLLIHGAGGASHSWRSLAPLLATRYRCTIVDLPGHGFTPKVPSRSGLDPMAADLRTLLNTLKIAPAAVIGHSAGGAIALRLAQDTPVPTIAINGAFAMFDGVAGFLFPLMAKVLALNPLTVPMFTASVSTDRARRLLGQTGSQIDADGVALYAALMRDRDHVSGTLAMMAAWRLERLTRAAPTIDAPVLLLAGDKDATVPAQVSRDMAGKLPNATLRIGASLGHLLHEEAPDFAAQPVFEFIESDHI